MNRPYFNKLLEFKFTEEEACDIMRAEEEGKVKRYYRIERRKEAGASDETSVSVVVIKKTDKEVDGKPVFLHEDSGGNMVYGASFGDWRTYKGELPCGVYNLFLR